MNYLTPSEYSAYGLPVATPEAVIAAASKLIDAHCHRPTLGVTEYTERVRVVAGANTVRLTNLPLAAGGTGPFVSARGRFAALRRGEAPEMTQAIATAFATPGTWSDLAVGLLEADRETGEVTFPRHVLGLPFNEVEIVYRAGLDPLPDEVKFACAQLAKNLQSTPGLMVKSGRVDTLKLEYFADALLDGSIQKLLAPYVAQRLR